MCLMGSLSLAGCDRQSGPATQDEAGKSGSDSSDRDSEGALSGTQDSGHAGSLIPAVNVKKPDGTELNLGALQGEPVLLNLWATWCAPCVTEMPMLDDLAGSYAGKLRVVTVSQDITGADQVVPFFKERGFVHLEPWMDEETELSFRLESGQLPLTILYDEQGQEIWRVAGGYDWSGTQARAMIDEGLGG